MGRIRIFTPARGLLAGALCIAGLLHAQDLEDYQVPRPASSHKNALQVIANYYKVQGGRGNVDGIETSITFLQMSNGRPGERYYQLRDHGHKGFLEVYSASHLGRDVSNINGFNGETFWTLSLADREPEFFRLSGIGRELERMYLNLFAPLPRFDMEGCLYTFEGKVRVRGRETYEIQRHPPYGIPAYVAFDAKTFLPYRATYKTRYAGVIVDAEVFYQKYIRQDGLWLAGQLERTLTGEKESTATLLQFEQGLRINPAVFDPVSTAEGWLKSKSKLPF